MDRQTITWRQKDRDGHSNMTRERERLRERLRERERERERERKKERKVETNRHGIRTQQRQTDQTGRKANDQEEKKR